MSDRATRTADDGFDGLGRWLVGALAVGVVVLGLLVAAFQLGYRSGRRAVVAAAPAAAPAATVHTRETTTPVAGIGPVNTTEALVARGRTLYTADGCAACHSLDGTAGAGPSLKGAAGRTVELADGRTVTADDAYLEDSISDPDAAVVKGYGAGIMPAAIDGFGLRGKPDDIRALVAFVKSQQ